MPSDHNELSKTPTNNSDPNFEQRCKHSVIEENVYQYLLHVYYEVQQWDRHKHLLKRWE